MASPHISAAVRKPDWTVLPWALIGAGFAMCLLALVLTRTMQSEPELGRILLLSVGLLCAGTAVTIPLYTTGPPPLQPVAGALRAPRLLALVGVFTVRGPAAAHR